MPGWITRFLLQGSSQGRPRGTADPKHMLWEAEEVMLNLCHFVAFKDVGRVSKVPCGPNPLVQQSQNNEN